MNYLSQKNTKKLLTLRLFCKTCEIYFKCSLRLTAFTAKTTPDFKIPGCYVTVLISLIKKPIERFYSLRLGAGIEFWTAQNMWGKMGRRLPTQILVWSRLNLILKKKFLFCFALFSDLYFFNEPELGAVIDPGNDFDPISI